MNLSPTSLQTSTSSIYTDEFTSRTLKKDGTSTKNSASYLRPGSENNSPSSLTKTAKVLRSKKKAKNKRVKKGDVKNLTNDSKVGSTKNLTAARVLNKKYCGLSKAKPIETPRTPKPHKVSFKIPEAKTTVPSKKTPRYSLARDLTKTFKGLEVPKQVSQDYFNNQSHQENIMVCLAKLNEGTKEEGITRISGSTIYPKIPAEPSRVKRVLNSFIAWVSSFFKNSPAQVQQYTFDTATASTTLKHLLKKANTPPFLDMGRLDLSSENNDPGTSIKNFIESLDATQKAALKVMTAIAKNETENNMSAENIALTMPSLFTCRNDTTNLVELGKKQTTFRILLTQLVKDPSVLSS